MTTHRELFLAAYDISDARRRTAALKLSRCYTTGGQKSVHEIYLTIAERGALVRDMGGLMNLATDRFLLLRLDPRSRVHALGNAVAPSDPDFFYVG
jgi:CRISPR-associated protein Cas2